MPEKVKTMTDPAAQLYDGVDRIKWVEFDGGIKFARRSGKAVAKYGLYRKADANSSTLAGFLEVDAVGVTGGHPTSVSSNDKLPVNFGLDKTSVMPTSNRAAVEEDRGKTYNLLVDASGVQFVNMTLSATSPGVVTIEDVIDSAGAFVSVKIPENRRWGNI
jgi:hypothetical protein